ncbi:MAG TPA: DUF2382 domain-containing protein [Bryobacteraceae bacterium]|nr:DUF2382 domain-containing protein [Bryobacteraceae bacterium]
MREKKAEPDSRTRNEDAERVIPVVEEELVIDKEKVTTGSVEIRKLIEERMQNVEVDVLEDVVDIRHVPVGVAIGVWPPVREDGDTLIIPVVEEEVVVTKRLVLKEEIHITRRRTSATKAQQVGVAREVVEVRRHDVGKQGGE